MEQMAETGLNDSYMANLPENDDDLKKMAVEQFTSHDVSMGKSAQMAVMTEEDFIKHLGQKGISVFHYDSREEFEVELGNA